MPNTEEKIVKIVDESTHSRGASVVQIGSKGALAVTTVGADSENLPGLTIPTSDAIVVTYPSTSTELYTYKTGGVSGTTVATITVTYTDDTKAVLSSVLKETP